MQLSDIEQTIKSKLTSNTLDVPVFHAVAFKLQQVLASPDFSIESVTQLIMTDATLTSQVLRIANSVHYGGMAKAASIRDATVRLGAREVANIAMLATQQGFYRSADPRINRTMKSLWEHALCTAIGSRWLAVETGLDSIAQEAFLAGLLHDIGKLFILKIIEDMTRTNDFGRGLSVEEILEILNNMHAEEGFCLMQKWNMPEIYCDVVYQHHLNDYQTANRLIPIIKIVNQCCNRLGIGTDPDPLYNPMATEEAITLKIRQKTITELNTIIEDAAKTSNAIARGGSSSL